MDYLEDKGVSGGCEELEQLVLGGLSYYVGIEAVGMQQDFIGVLSPNFPFCPSCTYVHKASLQMLGSLLSWWVDSFSFDMVFLFSSFSNSSATPSTTFVSHSLPLVLLPRTRIPFVDLAGILVVNPVKSTLGEEEYDEEHGRRAFWNGSILEIN
ncbi:hypothetical protein Csa_006202 [Cucumis sativus]|uniref:Uncharacterized protein n=1 Tax=Cucumis sativus TaxID=3659 RepID=A0A0A0LMW9_CUCSA|nr:hypothetical protein Csa_006202 [Cucumis sativus]